MSDLAMTLGDGHDIDLISGQGRERPRRNPGTAAISTVSTQPQGSIARVGLNYKFW